MKKFFFNSLLTKELKKNEILSICKLKNTYWKYGVKSQLMWFKKNCQNHDIHNLLYLNESLIGYNLLRERKFLFKKQQKNYFYFDTIVILKKYRSMRLGSLVCQFSNKKIKKKKLHSFLICKNDTVNFYKKNNWKKILKKNFKILDKKLKKNYSAMYFNQAKSISGKIIKYSIN